MKYIQYIVIIICFILIYFMFNEKENVNTELLNTNQAYEQLSSTLASLEVQYKDVKKKLKATASFTIPSCSEGGVVTVGFTQENQDDGSIKLIAHADFVSGGITTPLQIIGGTAIYNPLEPNVNKNGLVLTPVLGMSYGINGLSPSIGVNLFRYNNLNFLTISASKSIIDITLISIKPLPKLFKHTSIGIGINPIELKGMLSIGVEL